jgi:hypothetical protein
MTGGCVVIGIGISGTLGRTFTGVDGCTGVADTRGGTTGLGGAVITGSVGSTGGGSGGRTGRIEVVGSDVDTGPVTGGACDGGSGTAELGMTAVVADCCVDRATDGLDGASRGCGTADFGDTAFGGGTLLVTLAGVTA